jgi:hypothetical protein
LAAAAAGNYKCGGVVVKKWMLRFLNFDVRQGGRLPYSESLISIATVLVDKINSSLFYSSSRPIVLVLKVIQSLST